MKRVITKIGNIFVVNINENTKKYFQLIAFDKTQLNSDVIRAFKECYPIDYIPNLEEIVNGEIEFYAHCVTNWGVKMNLWDKVGTNNDIGVTADILFRNSEDYGRNSAGFSTNWYIWKINEDFKFIGKLSNKYQIAEIGIVVSPADIVTRMKTGKYDFVYPQF